MKKYRLKNRSTILFDKNSSKSVAVEVMFKVGSNDENKEIEDDGLGSWRTGVLVVEVVPGSAASKAGLVKGDVIMQLGYHSIDGSSDYFKAIKKLPKGEPVAIRLIRQGRSIFKSLELE